MSKTIRIEDDVYEYLDKKGRTSENFSDVLRRLLGLDEQEEKKDRKKDRESSRNKEKMDSKVRKARDRILELDNNIECKYDKTMVSFHHPRIKRGNGLIWIEYKTNREGKYRVHLRGVDYPNKYNTQDSTWADNLKEIRTRLDEKGIERVLEIVRYALNHS